MTGFVNLNKPEGITSFLCVAKVRRIMGEKKAGHSGTLDPMATGVLPIMLGGATRFLEFLPDSNKAYKATMRLGITTDTLDITGIVLSESDVNVTEEEVLKVSEKYLGDILQVPPMYSALNKDGVKLYKLARQGIEVEREARPVTIYRLDMNKIGDEYELYVECSSGTYIRTLIDDIGRDLGCGATMTSLKRTLAGGFKIERSVTLEELESAEDPSIYLTSVEDALSAYPTLSVSDGKAHRFVNGGGLVLDKLEGCKGEGLYRIYNNSKFLGLGNANREKNELEFKRVFLDR